MSTGANQSTEERLGSLNSSILNLCQIFDGASPTYLTNCKWFEIIPDLIIQENTEGLKLVIGTCAKSGQLLRIYSGAAIASYLGVEQYKTLSVDWFPICPGEGKDGKCVDECTIDGTNDQMYCDAAMGGLLLILRETALIHHVSQILVLGAVATKSVLGEHNCPGANGWVSYSCKVSNSSFHTSIQTGLILSPSNYHTLETHHLSLQCFTAVISLDYSSDVDKRHFWHSQDVYDMQYTLLKMHVNQTLSFLEWKQIALRSVWGKEVNVPAFWRDYLPSEGPVVYTCYHPAALLRQTSPEGQSRILRAKGRGPWRMARTPNEILPK